GQDQAYPGDHAPSPLRAVAGSPGSGGRADRWSGRRAAAGRLGRRGGRRPGWCWSSAPGSRRPAPPTAARRTPRPSASGGTSRVAEAEQIRAEEREGVFSRYLPYAVAFGAATPEAVGWYGNPVYFASSVEGFGSTAATTFVSTPSSSGSSGFSGGG